MNKTFLIGRLTRDIETRTTNGGKTAGNFTLAVDRHKKDSDADFIRCSAFGHTAELIQQYTHKGSLIGIEGHLKTGTYEKNGVKVNTCEVVVDSFDLI